MGEVLGVGLTHYPGPMVPDEYMAAFLRRTLESPRVPAERKRVESWPAAMQAEWGTDESTAAAARHRARLVDGFRRVRREIEAFAPDFILIWGDDQYENFREEIIPPFCVYVMDTLPCRPLKGIERWAKTTQNYWGEAPDTVFPVRGHPDGAKYLVRRLMESGFDVPYAYAARDERGLAHSFNQTLLYLDYDRTGFDVPIVPFHVNCYGSSVVRSRGGGAHLSGEGGSEPDPPGPSPARCFALGRAVARVLRESPWRVVLMGSSSWSHAFLTEKNCWLYPDIDSDRQRLAELKAGAYTNWAALDPAQVEDAGQHEILNWVCLAGAMTELNYQVEVLDFVETYVFNSSKCFAIFRPSAATAAAR
ncbi:MAG TPA: extradiol ring-cleavage dioxygenase [Chloroflexota bacterium]|jgi:hypothetical protein